MTFDSEGETIDFNLLRHACESRESEAFRVKLTTLTIDDILYEFKHTEPQTHPGEASTFPMRPFRRHRILDTGSGEYGEGPRTDTGFSR